ncbi:hypothetical protein [Garciella nitratireducens]|uniref:hypothetical protein n=1 Tax=Garciella nitratireducens TaxID=218205 RepID=UPI001BD387F1|nr:hypothetical protein [Garciella nitratireducens]
MSVTFTRFTETIHCKEDKRVVSVTVNLLLEDCTGTVYFTDIQAQEGNHLTGYTTNTECMLQKYRENETIVPVRFYNGVVRSRETIILFNLGSTSAGLDCHIYPNQNMAAGSIQLSQGAGAHKVIFNEAVSPGDTFSLLASTRQCLKNGNPTDKEGFFQYTASGDSKHVIKLEDRKSARVLFEFQEMQEGSERL